jgi:hypothetical protein
MSKKERKLVLSSRVDPQVLERVDKLAEETGVGRAEVIERAMMVGLEDQEKFVGRLRGAVKGPLLALLLNERFLDVIFSLSGDTKDDNQIRTIRNVRARAKRAAARNVGGQLEGATS